MDSIRVTQVPATLVRLGHRLRGTLHLTRFHMIFRADQREVWICYPIISEAEWRSGAPAIRIVCKDFMFLSLELDNEADAHLVHDSLMELTKIRSLDQLYAFTYSPASIEKEYNGWTLYSAEDEYKRMNLDWSKWRLTAANSNYALCPTYPRTLVVPTAISDNVLAHAAKFRSKGRLPVLSYHHSLNQSTIMRCSQPLIGIKQNRSLQDETLILSVFATTNPPEGIRGAHADNLLIDLRPSTNALAQIALGGGTENLERYRPARKVYSGIDNLHVMRDSLSRVIDALRHSDVSDSAPNPSSLDRSQWLRHVSRILDATRLVVEQVHFKCSHVVVHCSDGWDRTPQITSLAMLCLDPYYRTLEGFMVLIEKEWVSFGHQFSKRNREDCPSVTPSSSAEAGGNGPGNTVNGGVPEPVDLTSAANSMFANVTSFLSETTKGRQTGPIFQQFLDCAYQLVYKYPEAFEFNERFLRRLMYHSYACQYGTFLFNSEKEAVEADARGRTRSVWDYFLARRTQFVNPQWKQTETAPDGDGVDVLVVDANLTPRWWAGAFGRADADMNDPEAWRKSVKLSAPRRAHERASSATSANNGTAKQGSPASSENDSAKAGEHVSGEQSSEESTSSLSSAGSPEQSLTLTSSVVDAMKKATISMSRDDSPAAQEHTKGPPTALVDS